MPALARTEKVTFPNGSGQSLAARLDLPPAELDGGVPRAWCVFAHCFTCSKDIPAASRIARSLAARGFGVLRFDFTGLGSSDGDFANTNFSSNVDDLVHAAEFLRREHGTPQLLVGHSLGGAAVLAAARRIEGVEAVATIGAPADPVHVKENFRTSLEEIAAEGEAEVQLAGRTFTIKQQFVDDLDKNRLGDELGALDAALLVLHSPLDQTVPVSAAKRIYEAARGFKSFVSLGDADHLVSKKADAEYVADVVSAWATRYVEFQGNTESTWNLPQPAPGAVTVGEIARPFTNGVRTHEHDLVADEPAHVGGADRGPAPYELLLSGLGACTAMTLRMYADRKSWPLDRVTVDLVHSKVPTDDPKAPIDRFERVLHIEGDLDAEQRARLAEIADRCPVHRTLENPAKEILTKLAPS